MMHCVLLVPSLLHFSAVGGPKKLVQSVLQALSLPSDLSLEIFAILENLQQPLFHDGTRLK
jgi:hypothetical protein